MAANLADLLERELAGPESRSSGFSTEKTAKSYDESALGNQQKYAGASQFIFAIAYIAQKCRGIFKRCSGGNFFQVLTHLQRAIRKQPALDPPIESLLPRRT